MKKYIYHIILLVVCIASTDGLFAQPVEGADEFKSVDEFWKVWRVTEKCQSQVTHISFPENKDPDKLCRYYLINAYFEYCSGNFKESRDIIIKQVNPNEDLINPRRKDELFIEKGYEHIKNKLLYLLATEAELLAEEKVHEETIRSNDNVGRRLKNEFEDVIRTLDKNIPVEFSGCFDTSFEYSIQSNEIEFILSTEFCDQGVFSSPGYALAQIGLPVYYEELALWLKESIIDDWCETNQNCLDSISIYIEGHTDGHAVSTAISYGAGTFELSDHKDYYIKDSSGQLFLHQIDTTLIDVVHSNIELGLARANIAEQGFNILTNGPIQLISVQHNAKGGYLRKAEIRITAKGLFDADMRNFANAVYHRVTLEKKYIKSLINYP